MPQQTRCGFFVPAPVPATPAPACSPTALVHGAGPTGALAAFALAQAGWRVRIRDPLTAKALQHRRRAYAFTHSSQRLLQELGLWTELQPLLTPFRRLQLRDLGSHAAAVPFEATDLGQARGQRSDAAVGWIGAHAPLMAALLAALQRHPAVELELVCGEPAAAAAPVDLELAADGHHSPQRVAAGIGVWHHRYRQACLTAQVSLRGCGPQEAWELFRPEGPFALLPLGGGQFQVVWSGPAWRCQRLEALEPAAFLDALAGVLPDGLEPDRLLEVPRTFSVDLLLARRLRHRRLLLLGESAHRCHPVGGQGLNLCWRDVAELHRLALRVTTGRLPLRRLPAAYARRRWPDLLLTLAGTDLLVRLFSNRSPLLLPLRRLGLALLRQSSPLRRLSLGLMTDGVGVAPW